MGIPVAKEVYADREETGRLKDPTLEGRAEIIIGKQRNGPIGSVRLFFHKHYTRFDNFTARTDNFGGPKIVRDDDHHHGPQY